VSDAAADTDTILVTGASGVIGSRLVDRLVADGRRVRVAGRRPDRLRARWPDVEGVELDVLRSETLEQALEGVRVAHYLVHSMEPGTGGAFRERDATGASAFARAASSAGLERVVYLGGLGSEGDELSEHLESRHETGRILAEEGPPLVELRAAMVIGADSASYRMLTDLVRRLPAMVLPRWVSTPSQPIALDDVVSYLSAAVDLQTADRHMIFEIGGPDVLTYRDMIEIVARDRGRHPVLVGVPFLTPKLSSYWCAITTSVPMATAQPLIAGMTVPTVVQSDAAKVAFPGIRPVRFRDALARATAEAGRNRSITTI